MKLLKRRLDSLMKNCHELLFHQKEKVGEEVSWPSPFSCPALLLSTFLTHIRSVAFLCLFFATPSVFLTHTELSPFSFFVTPSVFVTHIKSVAFFFFSFFWLSFSVLLRLTGRKTRSYYCYSIFDLRKNCLSFSCFLSPAFLSIFDWYVNYLTSVFCYASLPEFAGFQYLSYCWVCMLESLHKCKRIYERLQPSQVWHAWCPLLFGCMTEDGYSSHLRCQLT